MLPNWHILPVSFNTNQRFTVEYSDTLLGLVQHLPDASCAWAEVERLHVPINRVDVQRGLTFGDLAQHYAEHELVECSESILPKAHTKKATSEFSGTACSHDGVTESHLVSNRWKWSSG